MRRPTVPCLPLAFALLGAARGASACEVRLSPDAAPTWVAAADAVRTRLAQPGAGSDCRDVTVEVRGTGAELRFTTKDGRVAKRALGSPEELGPQVDALVVAAGSFAPPPPPPPSPSTPPAGSKPAALLALGGLGGRLASANDRGSVRYLAPNVAAGMHGIVGPWELGIFVEWAPRYFDLSKDELAGFGMSSVLLGVGAGRRTPVGAGALRYGLALAVLQVNARADGADGSTLAKSAAQTHAGLVVGWVHPASRSTRLSAGVRGEAVIARGTGKKVEADRALPPLPGFGAVLTLGVETLIL